MNIVCLLNNFKYYVGILKVRRVLYLLDYRKLLLLGNLNKTAPLKKKLSYTWKSALLVKQETY